MPVWNARATLAEAAEFVLAQSRSDLELLLIDDGSTDGSRDLAETYAARDRRVRVLGDGVNRGPAAARNAGIRAARGRWIAFLDADDLWRPQKLEVQIGYMERAGAPFTFTALDRIDAEGRRLGTIGAPARVDYARLLKGNVIPCQTAAFDREHYGAVRDAGSAAPPGLRALADAAQAGRRGARDRSGPGRLAHAAGVAVGEQAQGRWPAPGGSTARWRGWGAAGRPGIWARTSRGACSSDCDAAAGRDSTLCATRGEIGKCLMWKGFRNHVNPVESFVDAMSPCAVRISWTPASTLGFLGASG